MQAIRTTCRIHTGSLLFLAICTIAGWGIGVVMALTFMHFLLEPGDGFVTIGIFCAFFGLLVGILARGSQNGSTRYTLAISMGQTRRSYLLWDSLASFLECLVLTGGALLLGVVERSIYMALYPGEKEVLDFIQLLFQSPLVRWVVLAACAVVVCLDLLFTALVLRFGRKGVFFFFVPLWLFTLVINPALTAVRSNPGSLMAKLGEGIIWLGGFLNGTAGAVAGAAVVLVLLGGCVAYLLRAPVRL